MKIRGLPLLELMFGCGVVLQGVVAIILALAIPDLPTGWVTVLVAIISLLTAWNAVRLQQVHKAVNSTATNLEMIAKQKEKDLAEALKGKIEAESKARELLILVAAATELPDAKTNAMRVVTASGTDKIHAAIISSHDDAIISKTLEGVITSWNPGAERLFGYASQEAVGQSINMLIPAGHEDEEVRIVERLRRGERIEGYETVRVTKDGHPVEVSLTISPIRDAVGRIIGASKIARRITGHTTSEVGMQSHQPK